jgi:hypothetical protein
MCTHLCHMWVHSRHKVQMPRESRRAPASTHVICCNNQRDEVARHKKCNILRYCAAQQQLCETCRCCKHAQISELEHIITVQGPQSQRKSLSADAPLCKDIEHSQCNLSSNCAAPQLLSSVSCVCSSAEVQCENPTCPATTPHLSVTMHTPTCSSKKLASTPPELADAQQAAPAQRPQCPAGQLLGHPPGRPRCAGGAHLAPLMAAAPGAGSLCPPSGSLQGRH